MSYKAKSKDVNEKIHKVDDVLNEAKQVIKEETSTSREDLLKELEAALKELEALEGNVVEETTHDNIHALSDVAKVIDDINKNPEENLVSENYLFQNTYDSLLGKYTQMLTTESIELVDDTLVYNDDENEKDKTSKLSNLDKTGIEVISKSSHNAGDYGRNLIERTTSTQINEMTVSENAEENETNTQMSSNGMTSKLVNGEVLIKNVTDFKNYQNTENINQEKISAADYRELLEKSVAKTEEYKATTYKNANKTIVQEKENEKLDQQITVTADNKDIFNEIVSVTQEQIKTTLRNAKEGDFQTENSAKAASSKETGKMEENNSSKGTTGSSDLELFSIQEETIAAVEHERTSEEAEIEDKTFASLQTAKETEQDTKVPNEETPGLTIDQGTEVLTDKKIPKFSTTNEAEETEKEIKMTTKLTTEASIDRKAPTAEKTKIEKKLSSEGTTGYKYIKTVTATEITEAAHFKNVKDEKITNVIEHQATLLETETEGDAYASLKATDEDEQKTVVLSEKTPGQTFDQKTSTDMVTVTKTQNIFTTRGGEEEPEKEIKVTTKLTREEVGNEETLANTVFSTAEKKATTAEISTNMEEKNSSGRTTGLSGSELSFINTVTETEMSKSPTLVIEKTEVKDEETTEATTSVDEHEKILVETKTEENTYAILTATETKASSEITFGSILGKKTSPEMVTETKTHKVVTVREEEGTEKEIKVTTKLISGEVGTKETLANTVFSTAEHKASAAEKATHLEEKNVSEKTTGLSGSELSFINTVTETEMPKSPTLVKETTKAATSVGKHEKILVETITEKNTNAMLTATEEETKKSSEVTLGSILDQETVPEVVSETEAHKVVTAKEEKQNEKEIKMSTKLTTEEVGNKKTLAKTIHLTKEHEATQPEITKKSEEKVSSEETTDLSRNAISFIKTVAEMEMSKPPSFENVKETEIEAKVTTEEITTVIGQQGTLSETETEKDTFASLKTTDEDEQETIVLTEKTPGQTLDQTTSIEMVTKTKTHKVFTTREEKETEKEIKVSTKFTSEEVGNKETSANSVFPTTEQKVTTTEKTTNIEEKNLSEKTTGLSDSELSFVSEIEMSKTPTLVKEKIELKIKETTTVGKHEGILVEAETEENTNAILTTKEKETKASSKIKLGSIFDQKTVTEVVSKTKTHTAFTTKEEKQNEKETKILTKFTTEEVDNEETVANTIYPTKEHEATKPEITKTEKISSEETTDLPSNAFPFRENEMEMSKPSSSENVEETKVEAKVTTEKMTTAVGHQGTLSETETEEDAYASLKATDEDEQETVVLSEKTPDQTLDQKTELNKKSDSIPSFINTVSETEMSKSPTLVKEKTELKVEEATEARTSVDEHKKNLVETVTEENTFASLKTTKIAKHKTKVSSADTPILNQETLTDVFTETKTLAVSTAKKEEETEKEFKITTKLTTKVVDNEETSALSVRPTSERKVTTAGKSTLFEDNTVTETEISRLPTLVIEKTEVKSEQTTEERTTVGKHEEILVETETEENTYAILNATEEETKTISEITLGSVLDQETVPEVVSETEAHKVVTAKEEKQNEKEIKMSTKLTTEVVGNEKTLANTVHLTKEHEATQPEITMKLEEKVSSEETTDLTSNAISFIKTVAKTEMSKPSFFENEEKTEVESKVTTYQITTAIGHQGTLSETETEGDTFASLKTTDEDEQETVVLSEKTPGQTLDEKTSTEMVTETKTHKVVTAKEEKETEKEIKVTIKFTSKGIGNKRTSANSVFPTTEPKVTTAGKTTNMETKNLLEKTTGLSGSELSFINTVTETEISKLPTLVIEKTEVKGEGTTEARTTVGKHEEILVETETEENTFAILTATEEETKTISEITLGSILDQKTVPELVSETETHKVLTAKEEKQNEKQIKMSTEVVGNEKTLANTVHLTNKHEATQPEITKKSEEKVSSEETTDLTSNAISFIKTVAKTEMSKPPSFENAEETEVEAKVTTFQITTVIEHQGTLSETETEEDTFASLKTTDEDEQETVVLSEKTPGQTLDEKTSTEMVTETKTHKVVTAREEKETEKEIKVTTKFTSEEIGNKRTSANSVFSTAEHKATTAEKATLMEEKHLPEKTTGLSGSELSFINAVTETEMSKSPSLVNEKTEVKVEETTEGATTTVGKHEGILVETESEENTSAILTPTEEKTEALSEVTLGSILDQKTVTEVGSEAETHKVFTAKEEKETEKEIKTSTKFISEAIGNDETLSNTVYRTEEHEATQPEITIKLEEKVSSEETTDLTSNAISFIKTVAKTEMSKPPSFENAEETEVEAKVTTFQITTVIEHQGTLSETETEENTFASLKTTDEDEQETVVLSEKTPGQTLDEKTSPEMVTETKTHKVVTAREEEDTEKESQVTTKLISEEVGTEETLANTVFSTAEQKVTTAEKTINMEEKYLPEKTTGLSGSELSFINAVTETEMSKSPSLVNEKTELKVEETTEATTAVGKHEGILVETETEENKSAILTATEEKTEALSEVTLGSILDQKTVTEVGSEAETHKVFTAKEEKETEKEIKTSTKFISEAVGNDKTLSNTGHRTEEHEATQSEITKKLEEKVSSEETTDSTSNAISFIKTVAKTEISKPPSFENVEKTEVEAKVTTYQISTVIGHQGTLSETETEEDTFASLKTTDEDEKETVVLSEKTPGQTFDQKTSTEMVTETKTHKVVTEKEEEEEPEKEIKVTTKLISEEVGTEETLSNTVLSTAEHKATTAEKATLMEEKHLPQKTTGLSGSELSFINAVTETEISKSPTLVIEKTEVKGEQTTEEKTTVGKHEEILVETETEENTYAILTATEEETKTISEITLGSILDQETVPEIVSETETHKVLTENEEKQNEKGIKMTTEVVGIEKTLANTVHLTNEHEATQPEITKKSKEKVSSEESTDLTSNAISFIKTVAKTEMSKPPSFENGAETEVEAKVTTYQITTVIGHQGTLSETETEEDTFASLKTPDEDEQETVVLSEKTPGQTLDEKTSPEMVTETKTHKVVTAREEEDTEEESQVTTKLASEEVGDDEASAFSVRLTTEHKPTTAEKTTKIEQKNLSERTIGLSSSELPFIDTVTGIEMSKSPTLLKEKTEVKVEETTTAILTLTQKESKTPGLILDQDTITEAVTEIKTHTLFTAKEEKETHNKIKMSTKFTSELVGNKETLANTALPSAKHKATSADKTEKMKEKMSSEGTTILFSSEKMSKVPTSENVEETRVEAKITTDETTTVFDQETLAEETPQKEKETKEEIKITTKLATKIVSNENTLANTVLSSAKYKATAAEEAKKMSSKKAPSLSSSKVSFINTVTEIEMSGTPTVVKVEKTKVSTPYSVTTEKSTTVVGFEETLVEARTEENPDGSLKTTEKAKQDILTKAATGTETHKLFTATKTKETEEEIKVATNVKDYEESLTETIFSTVEHRTVNLEKTEKINEEISSERSTGLPDGGVLYSLKTIAYTEYKEQTIEETEIEAKVGTEEIVTAAGPEETLVETKAGETRYASLKATETAGQNILDEEILSKVVTEMKNPKVSTVKITEENEKEIIIAPTGDALTDTIFPTANLKVTTLANTEKIEEKLSSEEMNALFSDELSSVKTFTGTEMHKETSLKNEMESEIGTISSEVSSVKNVTETEMQITKTFENQAKAEIEVTITTEKTFPVVEHEGTSVEIVTERSRYANLKTIEETKGSSEETVGSKFDQSTSTNVVTEITKNRVDEAEEQIKMSTNEEVNEESLVDTILPISEQKITTLKKTEEMQKELSSEETNSLSSSKISSIKSVTEIEYKAQTFEQEGTLLETETEENLYGSLKTTEEDEQETKELSEKTFGQKILTEIVTQATTEKVSSAKEEKEIKILNELTTEVVGNEETLADTVFPTAEHKATSLEKTEKVEKPMSSEETTELSRTEASLMKIVTETAISKVQTLDSVKENQEETRMMTEETRKRIKNTEKFETTTLDNEPVEVSIDKNTKEIPKKENTKVFVKSTSVLPNHEGSIVESNTASLFEQNSHSKENTSEQLIEKVTSTSDSKQYENFNEEEETDLDQFSKKFETSTICELCSNEDLLEIEGKSIVSSSIDLTKHVTKAHEDSSTKKSKETEEEIQKTTKLTTYIVDEENTLAGTDLLKVEHKAVTANKTTKIEDKMSSEETAGLSGYDVSVIKTVTEIKMSTVEEKMSSEEATALLSRENSSVKHNTQTLQNVEETRTDAKGVTQETEHETKISSKKTPGAIVNQETEVFEEENFDQFSKKLESSTICELCSKEISVKFAENAEHQSTILKNPLEIDQKSTRLALSTASVTEKLEVQTSETVKESEVETKLATDEKTTADGHTKTSTISETETDTYASVKPRNETEPETKMSSKKSSDAISDQEAEVAKTKSHKISSLKDAEKTEEEIEITTAVNNQKTSVNSDLLTRNHNTTIWENTEKMEKELSSERTTGLSAYIVSLTKTVTETEMHKTQSLENVEKPEVETKATTEKTISVIEHEGIKTAFEENKYSNLTTTEEIEKKIEVSSEKTRFSILNQKTLSEVVTESRTQEVSIVNEAEETETEINITTNIIGNEVSFVETYLSTAEPKTATLEKIEKKMSSERITDLPISEVFSVETVSKTKLHKAQTITNVAETGLEAKVTTEETVEQHEATSKETATRESTYASLKTTKETEEETKMSSVKARSSILNEKTSTEVMAKSETHKFSTVKEYKETEKENKITTNVVDNKETLTDTVLSTAEHKATSLENIKIIDSEMSSEEITSLFVSEVSSIVAETEMHEAQSFETVEETGIETKVTAEETITAIERKETSMKAVTGENTYASLKTTEEETKMSSEKTSGLILDEITSTKVISEFKTPNVSTLKETKETEEEINVTSNAVGNNETLTAEHNATMLPKIKQIENNMSTEGMTGTFLNEISLITTVSSAEMMHKTQTFEDGEESEIKAKMTTKETNTVDKHKEPSIKPATEEITFSTLKTMEEIEQKTKVSSEKTHSSILDQKTSAENVAEFKTHKVSTIQEAEETEKDIKMTTNAVGNEEILADTVLSSAQRKATTLESINILEKELNMSSKVVTEQQETIANKVHYEHLKTTLENKEETEESKLSTKEINSDAYENTIVEEDHQVTTLKVATIEEVNLSSNRPSNEKTLIEFEIDDTSETVWEPIEKTKIEAEEASTAIAHKQSSKEALAETEYKDTTLENTKAPQKEDNDLSDYQKSSVENVTNTEKYTDTSLRNLDRTNEENNIASTDLIEYEATLLTNVTENNQNTDATLKEIEETDKQKLSSTGTISSHSHKEIILENITETAILEDTEKIKALTELDIENVESDFDVKFLNNVTESGNVLSERILYTTTTDYASAFENLVNITEARDEKSNESSTTTQESTETLPVSENKIPNVNSTAVYPYKTVPVTFSTSLKFSTTFMLLLSTVFGKHTTETVSNEQSTSSLPIYVNIPISMPNSTSASPSEGHFIEISSNNATETLILYISGTRDKAMKKLNGSKWMRKLDQSGQMFKVEDSFNQDIVPLSNIHFPDYVSLDECKKADFEENDKCFCQIDSLVNSLKENINSEEQALKHISCLNFLKIKNGVTIGNNSVEHKRARRSYYFGKYNKHLKREILDYSKGFFNEELKFSNNEEVIYALPGSKVVVPCLNKNEVVEYNRYMKYTWMYEEDLLISDSQIQENEGNLVLDNILPKDSGNYSCTVQSRLSEKNKDVQKNYHSLVVVSPPIYKVRTMIIYHLKKSCELSDGDVVANYFPHILEGLLCGYHQKVCNIEVRRPICIYEDGESSINVTFTVTLHLLNEIVPGIDANKCNINCQIGLYSNLATIVVKNIESFVKLPIFSKLEIKKQSFKPKINKSEKHHRHLTVPVLMVTCPSGFGVQKKEPRLCVVCSKNTYNDGLESYCKACSPGQYQPIAGSKSCVVCSSPLENSACLRVLYTDTGYFKLYVGTAFGLVAAVMVLIFYCTRNSHSHDKQANRQRHNYSQNRRRRRAADLEEGVAEPLLKRTARTAPPPPPPF